MFTDQVGYTALTEKNETVALQLLEEQGRLLTSIFPRFGGKVIKTIGDGFLVEFSSAVEAVRCAVEIQGKMSELNLARDESMRSPIRIGIHVGDIVHRRGDIFGDGVNVASRIEKIAESGGICITQQVVDHVHKKVDLEFVRMGRRELKNVLQPVEVYRVLLPQEKSGGKEAFDRRRIAVLPMVNMISDPKDEYFADGMTEELISTLSKISGLSVISRTSVMKYKAAGAPISEIGSELKVGSVLEGSVRKSGNRVRITAQLIDVGGDTHVWAQSYDRELSDVFAIQSDIARRVADSLKLTLLTTERARIDRRDTENLAAYVAYLKGRTLLHDRTEKAIKGAKEQFELAIREDQGYAKAYSGLADIHMLLGDYLFAPFPTSLEEAKMYIKKALELDRNLPEARASFANSLVYDYRFAEAEREFRRAIALNPSYASAHHWYAICLNELGRDREAFAEVALAEELDPLSSAITLSVIYSCIRTEKYDEALKRIRKLTEIDPASPLVTEALMAYHFAKKDWDNALLYLGKMVEADPTDPYLDMDLAYIYAVTGRRDEALKLVEKLKAVPDSARIKGNLLAFVYAGLADLDECFKWLQYAFESREAFFGWFRGYPLLENVRRDPRFAQLLKKANLRP